MESLQNELQPESGVTPLFSMRTELLALSKSCHIGDADAQCKRALNVRAIINNFLRVGVLPYSIWINK